MNWNDLISATEAAKVFKKDTSYFRRVIIEGKLKENVHCKKIGKTWVFSRKALEDYFNNKVK